VQADDALSDDHRPVPALVLASGSRYRREQLARLGLTFVAAAPEVDEARRPDEPLAALAERLAADKARAVLDRGSGHSVVIGSDQIASLEGERLGKPGSAAAAREQLARSSGRTLEFLTAVHVLDGRDGTGHAALDRTRAVLRRLTEAEIDRYVAADLPLDCAGAFKVESLGIALFERIESEDPTALIGLPLLATARLLRARGFRLP